MLKGAWNPPEQQVISIEVELPSLVHRFARKLVTEVVLDLIPHKYDHYIPLEAVTTCIIDHSTDQGYELSSIGRPYKSRGTLKS